MNMNDINKKKSINHHLKKELGYWDITLATVGYIIGAGIYAVIGMSSKYGKDFTWLSILICGLFSTFTGMSYSELASMFNKNGGEYIITKEAFGKGPAKIVGLFTLLTEVLVLTSVAFGIGGYLSTLLPLKETTLAVISLLVFSYINYSGIRNSANYNNLSTILEVFGLIVISIFGFSNVNKNYFDLTRIDSNKFNNIILGSSLIFFAFFGFDAIIELTEETKNSEKVIPKAMMTRCWNDYNTLYDSWNICSFKYRLEKIIKFKSTYADVADKILGGNGKIILMIIAIFSMSNTLLMGHIGSSRFINSVSRNISLPFNLDKIDEKNKTPKNAIIFVTILSLIGLFLKNLENAVSFHTYKLHKLYKYKVFSVRNNFL